MPDDLYERYMAASKAHRTHTRTCATCTRDSPCESGARLHEEFGRLQDAYLNHPRKKR